MLPYSFPLGPEELCGFLFTPSGCYISHQGSVSLSVCAEVLSSKEWLHKIFCVLFHFWLLPVKIKGSFNPQKKHLFYISNTILIWLHLILVGWLWTDNYIHLSQTQHPNLLTKAIGHFVGLFKEWARGKLFLQCSAHHSCAKMLCSLKVFFKVFFLKRFLCFSWKVPYFKHVHHTKKPVLLEDFCNGRLSIWRSSLLIMLIRHLTPN